jgi:hypothetical protein
MTISTTPKEGDFGVLLLKKRNWFKETVISLVSWGTHSPAYHAVLVVRNSNGLALVEAEPGGAILSPIDKYQDIVWSDLGLTDTQRAAVSAAGLSYVGYEYGWYADAAIGVHSALRIPIPQFVWRLLSRGHVMECAQLVDAAELKAGVHLFNDGRQTGQVSPASLYDLIK